MQVTGLKPAQRRPRSVGKPAEVVVMEWTFAERRTGADRRAGLTLEFYVAKSMDQAVRLRERLMALRLPDGATERSVTLRERLPWPTGDAELELRLEQQDIMARGILAGLAGISDQGGSDGTEESA